MNSCKALKLAAGIMSTALFLSIPTVIAHADSFVSSEQGVAGISAILENTTHKEVADAYKASIKSLSEEESPYANLGVSIADDYVNIRKEASTDSKIEGKLYRGCAANILETLDNGWVKIESGHVKGYISTEFLVIGDDAKSMVDKYATKYAELKPGTQTLRVREKKSTDSTTLTLIPEGETYILTNEYDDWAEILIGNDDDSDKEVTGFVSKEFLDITVKFKYAVSIEEEEKKKKAQEEAERAERERKEKLAQEEAERKEAQQKKDSSNNSSHSSSSNSSSHNSSSNDDNDSSSSSHGSGTGSEIANYAQKFVGNPYVWGGTSLTHGADCSGFVQSVYEDFGYKLPRTSRDQAASAGRRVSESNLQPGDLIFYANSSGVVSHVAMYIGGGQIVHAATRRQGIIVSRTYKYRDVYCIKRIVN